jgi:hypothetical protein
MNADDLKEASWESLRPAVRRFAFHMEAILRRNDHKGGWENEPLPDLWYRLEEETKELADAIMVPERSSGSSIRDEAVDVANFAMMIFDNTLPGPMPNDEAYWAGKPEYIGSLKNLDDATLKGRRGTRLGVTQDHKPNIVVTGLAQARDVEKVYGEDLRVINMIPKETHYLLHLEAPTGKFDAEVTKKVWNEHVLPAWQTVPMHCDVAVANLEGVKKMELFSSPFEEWWVNGGSLLVDNSYKAMAQSAFEAGRKSVLGELDPKDDR